MIVYWILLLPTAFIAYVCGSISTQALAGQFVFHSDLRKLGRGNVWLSNFRRIYGIKGFLLLGLVEILKALIPILLGGLLLSIRSHGDVGRAFAAFCVMLGRLYPVFNRFRGCHGTLALVVASFCIDPSAGFAVAVLAAGLSWFTRYLSLGALGGAVVLIATCVLVVDQQLVVILAALTGALVIFRHLKAIGRLTRRQEPRLSFREDLSYKFDERL